MGAYVTSLASKCVKGLQLMEAMGFKDRGSFSKQIGGIQDESSDEEDVFVPNLSGTRRRDVKRSNK